MTSSKRVEATVVVPCLNGGRVLGACLAALDAQTVRDSLRVIVADGGSIDNSVARAREAADDVVTTTDPGIWGPRNAGLAATTTPFYLGLDADCVPSPAWAELLIEALRGAPADVIATGGRCEPFPTDDRWALRDDATPHPAFGPRGPLYVNGGNGCYRTELLRRLGGFPAYDAEDAALGAVARAAGLRYLYVPSATVQHRNPEGWHAYARNARKVGRYAAQFDSGPWRAHLIRTRLRMLGGALKPAMRGDVFESVALLTRAFAGGVGVIDVRRSRS
jgi:glycosyltransferase involved in cell wall biosynthesis